jgi:hypothetical protein
MSDPVSCCCCVVDSSRKSKAKKKKQLVLEMESENIQFASTHVNVCQHPNMSWMWQCCGVTILPTTLRADGRITSFSVSFLFTYLANGRTNSYLYVFHSIGRTLIVLAK